MHPEKSYHFSTIPRTKFLGQSLVSLVSYNLELKGNYWSLAGVKMGAETPLSMQMILQVPLSLAAVLKEKIMDVIIT